MRKFVYRSETCFIIERIMIMEKVSLANAYPAIANEWHPTKNGSLTPDKVYPASNIKVWWLCKNGHAYLAQPNDRIRNHGCPICNKSTSFAEQALFYYIRKSWPDTCSRDVSAIGMELDIFIPSLRIAVEYDGVAWHVNKSISEKKKNALCKTQGILLIRVREKGLDIYDDCCCVVRNDIRTSKSLDAAIEAVLNNISEGVKSDINTQRDRFKILELYAFEKEKNSLAVKYPQIAREWHPNKNGMLTPEKVSFSSKVVAWWLGECGHEWEMAVDLRTGKNLKDVQYVLANEYYKVLMI